LPVSGRTPWGRASASLNRDVRHVSRPSIRMKSAGLAQEVRLYFRGLEILVPGKMFLIVVMVPCIEQETPRLVGPCVHRRDVFSVHPLPHTMQANTNAASLRYGYPQAVPRGRCERQGGTVPLITAWPPSSFFMTYIPYLGATAFSSVVNTEKIRMARWLSFPIWTLVKYSR